jgi:predicted transcriptional regulator
LRTRLEQAARRLNRGKNAIITLALEEYLDKFNRQRFLEEARRQSILASAETREDESYWSKQADTSGWK